MLKIIEKSDEFFKKIISIQQVIANMFLIFIMTIITFDVLGRNIFNKPLKGTFEMTELGAALLVFFALAVTHNKGEHIRIDFVVEKLPNKVQNIINGTIELVIAMMLFTMSRHIFANGLRMMERKTTTTDLALPLYPFLFIVTLTLITFTVLALFKAIHYFGMAVNNK